MQWAIFIIGGNGFGEMVSISTINVYSCSTSMWSSQKHYDRYKLQHGYASNYYDKALIIKTVILHVNWKNQAQRCNYQMLRPFLKNVALK